MNTDDLLPAAEKAFVTFVSGWEFAALTTGKLPTITSKVRPLPKPVKAGIIAGAAGWFATHMWTDSDDASQSPQTGAE